MHNQAIADYKVLDGAFSLEFHDHKGCVAADHWWPLNDSFQGLTCRSLKTYVCLLMADCCQSMSK